MLCRNDKMYCAKDEREKNRQIKEGAAHMRIFINSSLHRMPEIPSSAIPSFQHNYALKGFFYWQNYTIMYNRHMHQI
jgi:hypothetical protein